MVLGNDLVCRLNFRSLCKLRNDVLDAISRARVNKMMIMQAIFKEFNSEDLMYPAGQEPDSPFKRGIEKFKGLILQRLQEQSVELGLPGKIIHFAKVSKCKFLAFVYALFIFLTDDWMLTFVSIFCFLSSSYSESVWHVRRS